MLIYKINRLNLFILQVITLCFYVVGQYFGGHLPLDISSPKFLRLNFLLVTRVMPLLDLDFSSVIKIEPEQKKKQKLGNVRFIIINVL